jgi:hypothetical protein
VLFGQGIADKYTARDIVRIPFQAHRTYHFKIAKGAPVVIELPLGEAVKNIWLNRMWFNAESQMGSSRIIVTALTAENVEGQRTNMHIETSSDFRITAILECIPHDVEMPTSVYSFYLTGQNEEVIRARMIDRRADEIASGRTNGMETKYKLEFERWKTETMYRLNQEYYISGTSYVSKVVDDCTQTFIFVPGINELASLRFINRDKEEEVINFEFMNNAYIVNRILVAGEQFVLTVGKDRTIIKRK